MNEAKATTTDSIISRLRCGSKHSILNVADEAADEIERLRKERDEARQEVCGLLVACHTDPDDDEPDPNLKHIHAGIRGWDCFKDNPTENA